MGISIELNQRTVPVTAIVTAFQRIGQTIETIARIQACVPAPAEILVHVDGNNRACEAAIREKYPHIDILCSEVCIGPGGGRNKLIAAAKYEIVASFDDDSYPLGGDYFERLMELFNCYSNASIICARIFNRGEAVEPSTQENRWVADFCGGACAYKREHFLATSGYVPLAIAYGMEEVDLAIRVHGTGGRILKSNWLHVYHDTDLERHSSPIITAQSIANIALLVYLRYPPIYWCIGIAQILNRIFWLLQNRRWKGIIRGLMLMPVHVWNNRSYKKRLDAETIKSYLDLRRNPVSA